MGIRAQAHGIKDSGPQTGPPASVHRHITAFQVVSSRDVSKAMTYADSRAHNPDHETPKLTPHQLLSPPLTNSRTSSVISQGPRMGILDSSRRRRLPLAECRRGQGVSVFI